MRSGSLQRPTSVVKLPEMEQMYNLKIKNIKNSQYYSISREALCTYIKKYEREKVVISLEKKEG